MARTVLKQARIAGCSLVTGEVSHRIDDTPAHYNDDPALLHRLKTSIGFDRRWTAGPGVTTADLCREAAGRLLERLGVEASSLDALISVTQTPDYPMPGNAHVLHAGLGLPKSALALDVQLGCSGYVYGLWLAAMMIGAGLKNVLLLAGDTLSKSAHPQDRTLAPLFGDAGSATLVTFSETASDMYFILRSDGGGLEKMYVPAGGYRNPSTPETREARADADGCLRSGENLYMNGFGIFEFTLSEQPGLLRDILAFSGRTKDEIDYFLLHQANCYIVRTITRKEGLGEEKAPSGAFSLYGNQNSASIPGLLCGPLAEALGDRSAQVVLQGYGIGLSWGACQTRLDKLVCCPVIPYSGGV